ncbi:TSUP family transporter [Lysobacter sp. K5869]|uniref:TSUP family transporter n=1 Tax=Lysobacter sp. K5869 TaxID=2820808 RepID=UPI001C0620D7|nr:TSUP family transporter [Lysobacter sp. K5869]QWP78595.1 TSUP family transporter [Lysobacter sp. K5869]
MEFSYDILLALFFISILAGCIDSIAGGGGLITLPALLAFGMPPAAAIATNKLGAVAGSFSASVHFIRLKQVRLADIRPAMAATFAGSLLGGFALTRIDSSILSYLIPVLLIGFALYFVFAPSVGSEDREGRISQGAYAVFVALTIGFYDGFFGPGTGTFFAISAVMLLGYNMIRATAQAKVLNFCSNLAALLFFLAKGAIVFEVGLAMLCGQIVGGAIGARLVVRSGTRLIRAVMVCVALAISVKMIAS